MLEKQELPSLWSISSLMSDQSTSVIIMMHINHVHVKLAKYYYHAMINMHTNMSTAAAPTAISSIRHTSQ